MSKNFNPADAVAIKTNIAQFGAQTRISKDDGYSSFLLRRNARRARRANRAI